MNQPQFHLLKYDRYIVGNEYQQKRLDFSKFNGKKSEVKLTFEENLRKTSHFLPYLQENKGTSAINS